MTIPTAAMWEKRCREVEDLCRRLGPKGAELIRLASMPSTTSDGWPSSSMGGEVRGSSDLTGPERSADAAMAGAPPDLVRSWLVELFGLMVDLLRIARRINRLEQLVSKRSDVRVRDAGAGRCLACGRDVSGASHDRLKGGHCEACRKAYDRAKDAAAPRGVNLAEFRWGRYRLAAENEGCEPSWAAFKDLQSEAS